MRQRLSTRARGTLSRGALISLLLHFNVVAPIVVAAWIYGGREEAQRAEEVDVAFQEADQTALPPDLPPIEPTPEPLEPPDKTKPEKDKDKKKQPQIKPVAQKKPEPPKPEKKEKPEPEVVVPPPEQMPPPPPPPPPPKAHEKMVDLDNDKNIPPPPDAKYLAQKNNRAEVETRATDTNLLKAQKGDQAASDKSDRTDDKVGAKKEQIAQLEEQRSELGHSAPEVTPHVNPEVSEDNPNKPEKSLLTLRDPSPRQHELTPETADLSLPHAADGEVPLPSHAARGNKSDASHLTKDKRVKLALAAKDYEYLFGATAAADRKLAEQKKSEHVGKFQQRTARVKAALENFIPEVKPGNQTALNTRAAPFAAYIARMHRSIHELWGFGQLEEWDEKSLSAPVNDRNRMTELEIVLNGDGTIDKVTVVRGSGLLEYDVAAIDVAYSAGPYPDPPREIRSANGKIYVHWRFYRDERQCATSGVDYFILNNPPANGDRPSLADAPRPQQFTGLAPTSASAGSSSTAGGPRRLQRLDDNNPAHRTKIAALDQEISAAEGQSEGAGSPAAPRAPAPNTQAVAPPAASPANQLLDMAALPFKTNNKDVARRADLAAMLADLMGEGVPRVRAVQLSTAAALRAGIG
ncbi:MAG TPA: TonB C-terminal domain-containing protein, partial [Polyangia bacterium]|nr:TonB C-terminal domain-containing protein [Polyangia bacterium]